jgi:hypothetical protein
VSVDPYGATLDPTGEGNPEVDIGRPDGTAGAILAVIDPCQNLVDAFIRQYGQDGMELFCADKKGLVFDVPYNRRSDKVAFIVPPSPASGNAAPGSRVINDVLDEDGIIQAETVIVVVADTNRVFLHGTQAGRGLARADGPRLVSLDRGYDGGGCRFDAAQVAKEFQRRALGGQHASRRAADGGDQVAPFYRAAVGPLDLHLDCRIDQSEGEDGKIQTGAGRRAAPWPAHPPARSHSS